MKHMLMMMLAFMITAPLMAADGPVSITFDPNKGPVDLLTGEAVSPCSQAQRGSVQFYLAKLWEPLDHVTYFKEGVQTIRKDRLWKLVKEQEEWDIWRPWYKGGHDGYPITQNIRTMAVSFIPLDDTGAPQEKVTIRLGDLNVIDWGID